MNYKELQAYENAFDVKFPPHHTVMVRVDGKKFSKLTANLEKPFDAVFSTLMEITAEEVANKIPGCKLIYTQSDEISFVIYNKEKEEPFFNNRIQKLVSVISSLTSVTFFDTLLNFSIEYDSYVTENEEMDEDTKEMIKKRLEKFWDMIKAHPIFDCRAFLIPEDEVYSAIIVRQENCENNGIQAMAHLYLDSVEGKTKSELRGLLFDNGTAWEDMPKEFKYGSLFEKIDSSNGIKWKKTSEKIIETNAEANN